MLSLSGPHMRSGLLKMGWVPNRESSCIMANLHQAILKQRHHTATSKNVMHLPRHISKTAFSPGSQVCAHNHAVHSTSSPSASFGSTSSKSSTSIPSRFCPIRPHSSHLLTASSVLTPCHRLHTSPCFYKSPPAPDPNFDIIYRFPYVLGVWFVCRLKLYQTAATLVAVPLAAVTQDAWLAASVGGLGAIAVVMLYIMGEFFRRFVGILYLSKDQKTLKVAHLTFWGNRSDKIMPVSDVLPFSELTDRPSDVYFKLRRYSCQDTFNVCLRYGGVINREKLEAVFGAIDER